MKCYVINLDRSPQRLSGVTEEFSAIGMGFERVPAVDGEGLSKQVVQELTKYRPDYRQLTAHEVGCVLSHRECWKRIATDTERFAAIFEDDVSLSASAQQCLKSSSWIPADSDLVKLETYRQKVWLGRRNTAGPLNLSVSRLWSTHWGTAGYIISRACALRLVQATERFSVTADDILFNPRYAVLRKTKIYQLNPAICMQRQYTASLKPDDPYRSTVPSNSPGPEAVTQQSKIARETARVVTQVSRLLKMQVAVTVPYGQSSDC